MKIRKGFVANSSSSSYICEVCDAVLTVYDSFYEDLGVVFCENDHVLEECHLKEGVVAKNYLDKDDAIKLIEELVEFHQDYIMKYGVEDYRLRYIEEGIDLIKDINKVKDDSWEEFFFENIANYISWEYKPTIKAKDCPLCTIEHVSRHTKLEYLLRTLGMKEEELEEQIKRNFSDLKSVEDFTS